MTSPDERLEPRAAELLDSSDAERVRYIQCDRFIPHSAGDAVFKLLNNFMTRPPSIRPPCLALIGDSDGGKTTLLNEFLLDEPDLAKRCASFTTDSYPIVEVMQTALLTALGMPSPMTNYRREKEANNSIKRALAELEMRLVMIDEIQHLLNLPRAQQPALWDWIKWISTACRVSIVCSGIPGSESIIARERQLHTRFSIFRLPRWAVGPAFGQFLSAYERSLPLRHASALGTIPMQQALLRETQLNQQIKGVTGAVKRVIEHAAIRAIETGKERITKELLSAWRDAYAPAR